MLTGNIRRLWRAAFLAIGLVALAGCASTDPRFEPAPLTQYPAGVSIHKKWSVSVGSGSAFGFVPVVVGDSVYAAAPNGDVSKHDLQSGKALWQADADTDLSAGVGSDGNITAVAAPDGTVIAFNDQGKIAWKAKATSQVNIPPTVGDGVVVVRSTDYRIQAFDEASGKVLWSVQRPGPALALKTNMQMILVQGMLISGLPNGKLIAIDAHTGSVRWEGTVSVSKGTTDLERISDVVGTPQIQGPVLCGVTYQGHVACFNVAQGGRTMWQKDISSTTGMTSDAQNVYVTDDSGVVHAYRLADGHEDWTQTALRHRRLSEPAVVRQGVAVGDLDGYVHFMSRTDGHLLGRIEVGSDPILSPLVATTEGVLVQTGNGDLVLIGVH